MANRMGRNIPKWASLFGFLPKYQSHNFNLRLDNST